MLGLFTIEAIWICWRNSIISIEGLQRKTDNQCRCGSRAWVPKRALRCPISLRWWLYLLPGSWLSSTFLCDATGFTTHNAQVYWGEASKTRESRSCHARKWCHTQNAKAIYSNACIWTQMQMQMETRKGMQACKGKTQNSTCPVLPNFHWLRSAPDFSSLQSVYPSILYGCSFFRKT